MSDAVLPPELLDYILDLLHNEPETLKRCCLVTKSWVPRTRRYIFADIGFYSSRSLKSWSNTFTDPTNSPALHVRTLAFDCYPEELKGADWIRSFSSVVHLRLTGHPILSFPLFHGFARNLKTLYVRFIEFSCPELFNFIYSFPLLENLSLHSERVLEDDENDFHNLKTSPLLTGSLKLVSFGGLGSAPRYLLSLPNGLRFRELMFSLIQEDDLRWIKELVLGCSDTLECLDVKYKWSGTYNFWFHSGGVVNHLRFAGTPDPIDLSKATKLKFLIFRLRTLGCRRVLAMLETITAEHRDLRQVSIHLPYKRIPRGNAAYFRFYLGSDLYEKWLELDRLLVYLSESRSIRPRVVITESMGPTLVIKDLISHLFPEITARGLIDLAEE